MTPSSLASSLLCGALLVLFLTAALLPSAVAADEHAVVAHSPSPAPSHPSSTDVSCHDSFSARLRDAESRLHALTPELTRSDSQQRRLQAEAASLSQHYQSLERRLQWIRHQLAESSSSSSSPQHCDGNSACSAELQRLTAKVAELCSALSAISARLDCIHAELRAVDQAIAAQEALVCRAQRVLQQLQQAEQCAEGGEQGEAGSAGGSDREALLRQLTALLARLCPQQAALAASLASLHRDVSAVVGVGVGADIGCAAAAAAAALSGAEQLWAEACRLYSALLLCRREAAQLAFLDWAERQLQHYQCQEREATDAVAGLRHHSEDGTRQLSRLSRSLQRLLAASTAHCLPSSSSDSSSSSSTISSTSSCAATCTPARLDSIAALLHSLHSLVVQLEQQAHGAQGQLHRADDGVRALHAGLAAVGKLGCEVEALIRQWRAAVEQRQCEEQGKGNGKGKDSNSDGKSGGKGDSSKQCERHEAQWKQAILRGLAAMGKALDCVFAQQQVVKGELAAVQRTVDNIDGCGLVRVEGRGLDVAGVVVAA